MNTLPRKAAHAPEAPTVDHLMDAPLPQLLAELTVEIVASTITDVGFFGAVVQRKTGELYLSMPLGRSELEHDTIARYLIAQALDVGLPYLPEPFATSEI